MVSGASRTVRLREESLALFARMHHPGSTPAEVQRSRDALVELHLPLVTHCARRFLNRGEPLDDLVQVGTIGLIKAVDRFDADRAVEFSTYATPTILGEIKRHFRDRGWAIRVPRQLQELRLTIGATSAELAQTLGRPPTAGEIAAALGVEEEQVLEAMESANAHHTLSLDAGDSDDEGPGSILASLGEIDRELENVEIRASIEPLLAQLPARERTLLRLRFFHGMSQTQIAAELGVSQMHVSRLLRRTLQRLRSSLQDPP